MKLRESTRYNRVNDAFENVYKSISPVQFKERYGITFAEWKDGIAKDDYRKNFKFSECYCDDDPYDQEICGKTTPIIDTCPERLEQACIDAAYEI